MSLNKIIRLGKATPEARRVAVTHPSLQSGVRLNTRYTGTLNVDIQADEDRPPVISIYAYPGALTYAKRNPYYDDPLNNAPVVPYHFHLRFYSAKDRLYKMLPVPQDYEIWVGDVRLSNIVRNYHNSGTLSSIVWSGQWNADDPDSIATFSLATANTNEPEQYAIRGTLEVLWMDGAAPTNLTILRIKYVPSSKWIVKASIDTNSHLHCLINYAYGFQGGKMPQHLNETNKATSEYQSSIISLHKVREASIDSLSLSMFRV